MFIWAIPFFNHTGGGFDKLLKVDIFCEKEFDTSWKNFKIPFSSLEILHFIIDTIEKLYSHVTNASPSFVYK